MIFPLENKQLLKWYLKLELKLGSLEKFFNLPVKRYETEPNRNSKNLPTGIKYDANPGWLKKNNLSSINGFSKVKLPANCEINRLISKKNDRKKIILFLNFL